MCGWSPKLLSEPWDRQPHPEAGTRIPKELLPGCRERSGPDHDRSRSAWLWNRTSQTPVNKGFAAPVVTPTGTAPAAVAFPEQSTASGGQGQEHAGTAVWGQHGPCTPAAWTLPGLCYPLLQPPRPPAGTAPNKRPVHRTPSPRPLPEAQPAMEEEGDPPKRLQFHQLWVSACCLRLLGLPQQKRWGVAAPRQAFTAHRLGVQGQGASRFGVSEDHCLVPRWPSSCCVLT